MSDFRALHLEELSALLAEAVKLGTIAVDGIKVKVETRVLGAEFATDGDISMKAKGENAAHLGLGFATLRARLDMNSCPGGAYSATVSSNIEFATGDAARFLLPRRLLAADRICNSIGSPSSAAGTQIYYGLYAIRTEYEIYSKRGDAAVPLSACYRCQPKAVGVWRKATDLELSEIWNTA